MWRPSRLLPALVLAAAGAVLAACATSKQVVVPVSGIDSTAYIVDCSGASLTWSHCYRKAGQTCPRGYKILANSYKHGERIVSGDVLQLAGDSASHRRMLIECHNPHGRDRTHAAASSAPRADSRPGHAVPLQR